MYFYLFMVVASCRHFVSCVLTMLASLIRVMKVGTFSMPFVPTVISTVALVYEYYHCGAAQTASSVILYQISNNTTVPKLNIDVQTSQEVRLRNVELN